MRFILFSLRIAWISLLFGSVLRPDVVLLDNGDRLSGQVQKLEQQKLSLKTAYAGTIQIDWAKVQELTTEGGYELEAETGRRIHGRIQRSADVLEIASEDETVTLPPATVVRLTPMSDGEPPGFWQILNGAVDLGYSFTRGNSRVNQSSVGLQGNYRREKYELRGGITSFFSKQDEAEPTSRQTADARYDRFVSPRSFYFGLLGLERNDRQRLNLRSRLGGGFGWNLIRNQETQFSLLGGFTYINEQFRDVDSGMDLPRTSSGEALGGFEFETVRLSRVRLTTKLSVHPNLVQAGRYRVEYDSTVRLPVLSSLTWSLSLFDRFDSEPPQAVQRNDYGLVSAFGFTF
jgi:putative salt-induced outer membrane protein YdiY